MSDDNWKTYREEYFSGHGVNPTQDDENASYRMFFRFRDENTYNQYMRGKADDTKRQCVYYDKEKDCYGIISQYFIDENNNYVRSAQLQSKRLTSGVNGDTGKPYEEGDLNNEVSWGNLNFYQWFVDNVQQGLICEDITSVWALRDKNHKLSGGMIGDWGDLVFKDKPSAEKYMQTGEIDPSGLLNFLRTLWTCYYTESGTGTTNVKLLWNTPALELDKNNVTQAKINLSFGVYYREVISEIINYRYSGVIPIKQLLYTDSFFTTNSDYLFAYIVQIGYSHLEDIYLIFDVEYNGEHSEQMCVKFAKTSHLETGITKYPNSENIITDGSTVQFIEGTGDDDNGYTDRKDITDENMIENVYERGSSFVTSYVMNSQEVNSLGTYLWQKTFLDDLILVNNNPIENIISVYQFPWQIDSGTDVGLTVGNVLLDGVNTHGIESDIGYRDIGEFTVTGYYGNFLDFEPYSSYYIYLPFIGFKQLNFKEMQDKTWVLRYVVDYVTGVCNAVILDGEKKYVLLSFAGNIGISIPVSNSGNNEATLSRFTSGISTFGSALGTVLDIAGVASGNPTKILSGANGITNDVIGTVQSAIQTIAITPHSETSGSASPDCESKTCTDAYIFSIHPQFDDSARYRHTYGKPCYLSRQIKDMTGYTVIDPNSDLTGLTCTTEEKDLIRQILSNGFYI